MITFLNLIYYIGTSWATSFSVFASTGESAAIATAAFPLLDV